MMRPTLYTESVSHATSAGLLACIATSGIAFVISSMVQSNKPKKQSQPVTYVK